MQNRRANVSLLQLNLKIPETIVHQIIREDFFISCVDSGSALGENCIVLKFVRTIREK